MNMQASIDPLFSLPPSLPSLPFSLPPYRAQPIWVSGVGIEGAYFLLVGQVLQEIGELLDGEGLGGEGGREEGGRE